ncbi:MAG TPA: hypothetical protein VES97_10615 [Solirubrobacteraceae bacterium]|nr:hypothetical protein [Solirubrobacteraceae bacterium]
MLAAAARSGGRWDRALVVAGGAVVLVVLLATLIVPYLDQRRRIATEVPQPAPLFAVALVELLAHQQTCADQIGLLPGRQVAEMRIGTFGKPPSPLLVTFLAPGYRASASVPPTYVDNALIEIPFSGPGKVLQGSVCVRNQGHTHVALYASDDRTKSRSATTVDGRPWPANFDLAFYAARERSLLDQAGTIMRRLRLFHAHVGLGLLWLLAVLFAIGVPLAGVAVVAGATGKRPQRVTPAGKGS